MRRRTFITLLGGATAWPLAARAQQPERPARIGYLALTSASQHAPRINAFRAGLRKLGYVEGRNLHIEFRSAEEDNDRLPGLAAELVRLNVDVIVTYATGVDAAKRATATIPIVMTTYSDAVSTGVIASLARPGGNVTGSTFFYPELMAKRLQVLKELVPSMSRAGVLLLRGNASNSPALESMRIAAEALKVGLEPIEVRTPTDYASAISAGVGRQIDALVVGDHAFFIANTDVIAGLAANHKIPSIGFLELAASGGLMAYGVNFTEMYRRAAVFVDKILKGAKPGDIPVEQAVKFELIINLKTAKALGLDVPLHLQQLADEVIE
jgi:putative ABC transport system substrate-binding protein